LARSVMPLHATLPARPSNPTAFQCSRSTECASRAVRWGRTWLSTGTRTWAGVSLAWVMTDFCATRVSPEYRRFCPSDAASLCRASVACLRSQWGRSDLPTAAVSRHAPSARSLDPRFGDNPVNAGFACALESLIERLQPATWIHGHVHRVVDYMVGSTRLVCNPRGYPDEFDNGFDPGLIIGV
jgi:hypothetical protein